MVGCGADNSKALGKHESCPKEQFFPRYKHTVQRLDAVKTLNASLKAFLSTIPSPQAQGGFFFSAEILPKRNNIRCLSTFPKRSNIIQFLPS